MADLDDPTEIEEINETMETALSGSGTEAQAGARAIFLYNQILLRKSTPADV